MSHQHQVHNVKLGMLLAFSLVACRGASPLTSKVADASYEAGAQYSATGPAALGPNVSTLGEAGGTSNAFITSQQQLQLMLQDLRSLQRQDQVFARYFVLTNLWNAGATAEQMTAYRNGVSKMVNSLSYAPQVVAPVAIDPNGTIMRVDLRAYGWDQNFGRGDLWEEITVRDPYAFFSGTQEEAEINARTGVGITAFVRADWCASVCLQGDIYDILMQIPGNLQQLEFDFGVDSVRDDANGNVQRAGMSRSFVSSQYRMIEAHPTQFGTYWKSWDFEQENARVRRNLFEFPLDPFVFGGDGFDFAAGEMIFQLPNGLSLYMLADNNAQRLEKAVTQVVQDPTREDAAVTNAISCFRCHVNGMINTQDEVRAHFEKNAFAFSRQELAIVEAEYVDAGKLKATMDQYNQKYGAAVQALSQPFPYSTPDNGYSESVTRLARQFEGQINLQQAAAELGLTPDQLTQNLQQTRLFSRRIGNMEVQGSSVKRAVFEDNFPFLIDTFGIGQPFFFRNLR